MTDENKDKPKKSCTTQKVNLKREQEKGKTNESKGPRDRGQYQ